MPSIAKQQHKDFVRNAIITATEHLVLSEGWQAVSIRKIAEAIGYSLPVVYQHFEDKEALHQEFVRKGFEKLTAAVTIGDKDLPEEEIREVALAYFNFAFKNEAYYKLMFGLGIPSCDKAKEIPELEKFAATIINLLKRVIVNPTEDLLKLKFRSFWSILHGFTSINMVSATAAPDHLQQKILLDIIQGFTININD